MNNHKSNPEPDAPQRVCMELVDVITQIPDVISIAVFGSLADDSWDAYSDVDLLVVTDCLDTCAWQVADAIGQCKPVQFYRMFSSDRQPAGRYWFADESPLTRLDISFHSSQTFAQLQDSGRYMDHPVAWRLLYQRDNGSTLVTTEQSRPIALQSITADETHLGERIYRMVRAIKNDLRQQSFRYSLEDCINWLNEAITQTQAITLIGGDGHALARACLVMARQQQMHHAAD
tara:strand:+ start:2177 stop:2872 length:696 start_codon:yes stop_codon:yes gene_type:complete